MNRLLNAGSEQYGAGAAIRLPILDAGRLRANVRGKTADLDAAVDSYNAALIEAVRDAADLMARELDSQIALARALGGGYDARPRSEIQDNSKSAVAAR